MRAIPLLVVLVWTFFAFPLIAGISLNTTTAGIIALSVHLGAYMTGQCLTLDGGYTVR